MALTLLRNGTLLDGSGAPPQTGSVLLDGEKISLIGPAIGVPNTRVIDCTGLIIAPGFIDSHSHSDLQILENRPEKPLQGVTTEVVGNCGFSPYPAGEHAPALRAFANGIFCGSDTWGWPCARDYLKEAGERSTLLHPVSLVGHGSLRISVAGMKMGPLDGQEMDQARGRLRESLEQGAAGFSTGLMYAPGSSAPFEEVLDFCRVVARLGRTYATHMRSYSFELLDSVEEQLELARRSGCRLQISHFQAVGRTNWEMQEKALELIESARVRGVDVAFDCYPYTAGSTVLTQMLPQWVLEGGVDTMMARLLDPAERAKIAGQATAQMAQGFTDVYISATGSAANAGLVGRNLHDIGELKAKPAVEAMIDLLIEERGDVNMYSFNQSEANLRQTLAHPLSSIISDGFYVKGKAHPRLYGTFPTLLGEMVRTRGWMPLEEAVHKITQAPAERFHMTGRGQLRPGFFADVTVFDAGTVGSEGTYERPDVTPAGIRHVFRNGVETVRDGRLAA